MVQKKFVTDQKFLHIPVHCGDPEIFYYVEVWADGEWKNEFLIGISVPGEKIDHYVAMDLDRYHAKEIELICKDEGCSSELFEGITAGGEMKEHPEFYPDLYHERSRQQIHFSPARGWMNDPNGLFYKDGKFHMYFQHNSFANHHNATNVSWGLAISEDGVHFKEYADPLRPKHSRLHIASGSAIVDQYDISGMGKGTVLAAYTDLFTRQYHGRPAVTSGGGQNLLYSKDDGMTFRYFEGNPVIPVPDYMEWRDPKILQIDEHTLCIAVYETYEGENCISFYKSTDCRKWEFCSRIMNFYECPDLFKLKVKNSDEYVWAVYGASGKYLIGQFENFEFKPISEGDYIDFGDCVYAGQTFNNYEDETKRIYTAWLRDHRVDWNYQSEEPDQDMGFSQSMALFTEFTVLKTRDGYRMFRAPISQIDSLRKNILELGNSKKINLSVPSETVFVLKRNEDAEIRIGSAGFRYEAEYNRIASSSGKACEIYSEGDLEVRVFADRNSVEIYIQNEIVMSFSVNPEYMEIESEGEVAVTQYELKSIWDEK